MPLPKRISGGPLPEDFADMLRRVTANTFTEAGREREHFEVESSFTGKPIGYVLTGTAEDVDVAFERARAAQERWADTPVRHRVAIFRDFHDRVLAHKELLMDLVQLETGKNRMAALDEVMDVVSNARYYSNQAPKLLAEKRMPGGLPLLTQATQQQVPVGVVGQISPWNYPLALGVSDAIPALLAGNAVVSKPDWNTPFSALIAIFLLYQSGLPRELFQAVTGSGPDVGGAIAERCDYLMFTGSTATGRILGRTAGERLIGYSAELGGKNPLIVAADADLDKQMSDIVSACYSNAGQLCVSTERVYVVEDVYDSFLERFIAQVKKLRVGAGFDWNVDVGSLIHGAQLERVEEYLAQAIEAGATVACGGNPLPDLGPYFFEPTVLTGVTDEAKLSREEVFGPLVYVEKVADLEEALRKANDTDYGLNACVFAAPETGRAIARRLEAGGVGINDGYAAAWATIAVPLGGVKQSGQGRRHGSTGLLKYTETKNIAEQRFLSMRGPSFLGGRDYARVMTTALSLGKRLHLLP